VEIGTDLRTKTTLVCGALSLVIAVSILLRGRVRTVHLLFAAFAGDIGLWYLSQSLANLFESPILVRFTGILTLLLPQFALHLFAAMIPQESERPSQLRRWAMLLAFPLVLLLLSPVQQHTLVRIAVFLHVFAFLTAGLFELWNRGAHSGSRATQRRVRLLVVLGALAGLASVADFAWFLGVSSPPIGAALSIGFLFVLAQALRHERLLDVYEMLARLVVATLVSILIAGIFYILVTVVGGFNTMYLNAVLAAIVILVLVDPLRERVAEQTQRLIFRDRVDLERSVADARRRLVHVLELEDLGPIVTTALEQSRRVTKAALYLRDQDRTGFNRLVSLGPNTSAHVEMATARALLDRLVKGPVSLEEVERDARERKTRGERTDMADAVLSAAGVLGSLADGGVVLPIGAENNEIIGLLVVADDRVRDAFSPEEIALLDTLATQVGVVIQNSRLYQNMKERDRLAVLGQMAAGLAHEIRNPLGAIKGAAQLLAEPNPDGKDVDPTAQEFIGIILEEVERLDRVVGSVLDLARTNQGSLVATDVNAVLRRTLQVLSAERSNRDVTIDVQLEAALPRVVMDPEQLRQVVMNLFRNAAQAMAGRGKITIKTRVRPGLGATLPGMGAPNESFVEIIVTDTGPGISQKVLKNLFLPFFTTKDKGTGLGLAISQGIAQAAGGRIEVQSYEGKGTTFAVILPAASKEALGVPSSTSTPIPGSTGSRPEGAAVN
jgi:two-component system, NtrC family, sensor histidine kinase HydH